MVDISFGNLSQVDGRNVLTGGQSGIDTDGLITALSETRRLPAVALETEITENLSKISALGTLDTRLQALESALNGLRRPSGFGSASSDVFESRLAFQTASDGSAASNYFGVVANNGASIRSYDVEVLNLAVAESRRSITFSSQTESVVNAAGDETSGFFSEGTFQINGEDITLNEGENLINLASKINSQAGRTGVGASILKISDTEFRFVITSTETGDQSPITITDATDSVFVGGDESDIFATTIVGEAASIRIDGDVVTRQTNVFNDVVDGVTFSLFQETSSLPNAPVVKVDVGTDTAAISEAIVTFIDAYNDVRVFLGEQTARGADDELLETSVLAGNTLLNTVTDSILRSLGNVVGISNPFADTTLAPTSLTDLGIAFDDFDGDDIEGIAAATSILTLDATVLASQLESNFEEVRAIFGFEFSTSSSNLNLFDRGTINPTEVYSLVVDESNFGSEVTLTHIDGHELATPVTNLTYTVGGINDGFTEFDGADDTVQFAAVDFGTDNFVVEASAFIDSFDSPNIVLGGAGADDYVLNIVDASTVSIKASNSGNVYSFDLENSVNSSGAIVDRSLDTNTFYNFKIQKSGDSLFLTLDGTVVSSIDEIPETETFDVSVIGGNNSPAVAGFDGRIRDVTITNDGTVEADFLLDRDFNDRSGNNNHGTATGSPEQTRSTKSTVIISGSGDFEGLQVFYTGGATGSVDLSDSLEGNAKDYTINVNSAAQSAEVTHIRGQELASSVGLAYAASSSGGATITSTSDDLLGELTFLFLGGGNESIDISFSQGFADNLYQYLEEVNNGGTSSLQGAVQDEIDSLRDSNDLNQESIDRIDTQVNIFTQQLLIEFAALEAAIAASNSILQLLEAQTDAANNA